MKILEDRILNDGKIFPGDVLKVDSFVNHQIDIPFMNELAKEIFRLYRDSGVNKILTIEASGIAMASLVALQFNCPLVFAKKSKTSNIADNLYTAEVASYTHKNVNTIVVSKDYINNEDNILIVDDFLAKGNALKGLIEISEKAGAKVSGAAIIIEKQYQGGGDLIRKTGVRVESLAKVKSMSDDGKIEFTE